MACVPSFCCLNWLGNNVPKSALSLTHDLLRVLSMDTWWNFGHELKKFFLIDVRRED